MTYLWALPALSASLIGSSAATTAVEPPITPVTSEIEAIAPNITDPQTEIIDLDEDRANRFTVPVTIEGSGPFDFMIDTGSQATAVTHQINDGLQLTPFGTATLVGMASTRPVNVVEVDSMSFGSHTVHDIVSPVLDARHVGADGILGLDSLQDLRVLIDFREETIAVQDVSTIRNHRAGFEIIVRARRELGQLLITSASVEGVDAIVIIDTGAQGSIGNLALQRRLRNMRAQEVTTTDVNGVDLVGELSYVRSLNIEGLSLQNVPLAFADAPAFEALGLKDTPVISLGMQHLRMFDRVAIDFSNQRILFDVPRDVARALRRQRSSGYSSIEY
ncbi:aspartyl protease family protein [uncultured Erythrobacter sp.]|uniref:aspartyl protease family protein n=1 Tax=uncultured Erythrobacter sp. TaxID=263913 RepID=UPI002617306B|nr:aspartyl protease family protein [uncultured Erythrobacter sp.]